MNPQPPPTPVWCRWRVTLLEDLHTGTGTGRGHDLDAVQARDAEGRPVIRDTHGKGLLLEAARELRALDAPEATDEAIARLFGRAGEGSRGGAVWGSLRTDAAHATFVSWGSTARVPGQRAPQEDTLRIVEHVAAGTTFTADIVLRDPALYGLLAACVRRCDHLGAQRSRGVGLLHGTLDPVSPTTHDPPAAPREGALRLRLLLRAVEPLCLPATGSPETQAPGESFLRATTLRGALLAMARRVGADEASALADRRVLVGNGWPLPHGVTPPSAGELATVDVLPMPLHLGTPKAGPRGGATGLPWWLGDTASGWLGDAGEKSRLEATDHADRLQRPKADEYLARWGGSRWRRYRPLRGIHLRNTPPHDRSVSDAALFGEGEIAEETHFVADLEFPSVAAASAGLAGLDAWLRGADLLPIGRGGRPLACVDSCWLPTCREVAPSVRDGGFTLVLESDLLARDAWLGFHQRLTPEVVASLAGCDAAGLSFDGGMSDVVEVRGFNAVSGLPREVAVALRRGSVLRVKGPGAAALRQALAGRRSLGERAWEGFGRFRLDPGFVDVAPSAATPDDASKPTATWLDLSHLAQADALGRRLASLPTRPSPSQWQCLRQQVNATTDAASLTAVLDAAERHAGETRGGSAWRAVPWSDLRALASGLDHDTRRRALDLCFRRVLVASKGERP